MPCQMVSKVPLVITKNIRGEVTFMWAFCVTFNQQNQTPRPQTQYQIALHGAM